MNEDNQLAVMNEEPQTQLATTPEHVNNKPPPDAKALRTEAVGALLSGAYAGASTLKLKPNEVKDLTEPFPDDAIEIRPFDGIIYISHMLLRERLWKVFGPTEVAEICRERFMRPDSNEIAVDLVLMARGKFLAEGVGTAKYYPNNAKGSFGDTVESAWSEALRRCAKKIGLGTQVWRPQFVRDWLAHNAVQQGGKWDAARRSESIKRNATARRHSTQDAGLHAQGTSIGVPEDEGRCSSCAGARGRRIGGAVLMRTHAKVFLLFCTIVSIALGQRVAVKTGEQHAYIIPGKIAAEWTFHDESRVWLTVVTSNHRDWATDGYDPSFTSVIVKDYKPVVHLRQDGAWEVTFTSPVAEGIP